MNFQNLEYFIAAAEESSISRAAERLNISQQALSGSIARLEKEMDCRLFDRRPDLSLTYSGKCFLKTANSMLDLKKQSDLLLGDINDSLRGELRIGVSHTRGQAILPFLLPEFNRRYPKAELSIAEASTTELEKSLERGKIDVMIGFMPVMSESAEMQPLMKDRLMLVLPKTLLAEHFGSHADRICEKYRESKDISLFKDMPFILLKENERIRKVVNREFTARGIYPIVRTETQNIQTAFSLASEGMGISICPELYLKSKYTVPGLSFPEMHEKITVLPFSGTAGYDTIGIGYNRDRYLSRIAKDFINITVERCKLLTEQ